MTKGNIKNEIIILTYEDIKDKIYTIRGQKVMIDSDLAEIYGYTTKTFNQQVKNNIEKFEEDFRFQLTSEEYYQILRSKNLTLELERGKYSKYLPYVFTEQGVYMLMTVLKGELATIQSKNLVRIFKGMKDYIIYNDKLNVNELIRLSNQTDDNTKNIKKIEDNMKDYATKKDIENLMTNYIDKNRLKENLILNGEIVEADIAYSMIYSLAKESIYIIDNYIDLKTLVLLKNINKKIIIFSDNINKGLHKLEYLDFKKEYNVNVKFKKANNKFYDRYIILDYGFDTERIYLCGSSSKDSGKKITSIVEIENTRIYHTIIDELLNNKMLII